MRPYIPLWKHAPFLRIFLALAAGIFLQSIVLCHPKVLTSSLLLTLILILLFKFLSLRYKFKFYFLPGILVNIAFLSLGAIVLYQKDISNRPGCIVNYELKNPLVRARIEEPPVEKNKSWKAIASVVSISHSDTTISTSGNIIVYFQKENFPPGIDYGRDILFRKSLQKISSPPSASFDYASWCSRQGIFRQVYLKTGEYAALPKLHNTYPKSFLIDARERVTSVLRKFIPGKKESGFAQALLIGYKNDLDKDLVQAYSNTGAVHIIAISGLHLGIIYALLSMLFKPVPPKYKWSSAITIILALWMFSLLAGGGPSVLRSAIMFSFLLIGKTISSTASIYNNLAASAFVLLCVDPFWLWDVGFQLSYAAVLSIVIFYRPVYSITIFKNQIFDNIWKLTAVTLSAQILAVPICLFNFHQFPTYFLLANLPAIPLSTLILLGEILLCCISTLPRLAAILGNFLNWLIGILNEMIERVNDLPYSTITGLAINEFQLISLYILIAAISNWLMKKSAKF